LLGFLRFSGFGTSPAVLPLKAAGLALVGLGSPLPSCEKRGEQGKGDEERGDEEQRPKKKPDQSRRKGDGKKDRADVHGFIAPAVWALCGHTVFLLLAVRRFVNAEGSHLVLGDPPELFEDDDAVPFALDETVDDHLARDGLDDDGRARSASRVFWVRAARHRSKGLALPAKKRGGAFEVALGEILALVLIDDARFGKGEGDREVLVALAAFQKAGGTLTVDLDPLDAGPCVDGPLFWHTFPSQKSSSV